jgi:hypothetical protein
MNIRWLVETSIGVVMVLATTAVHGHASRQSMCATPGALQISSAASLRRRLSAASVLKTRAHAITEIQLVSCERGKQATAMPRELVTAARKELGKNAQVRTAGAMSTPPWGAYLVFHTPRTPPIFAQLVYDHVLRVAWIAPCGPGGGLPELHFDSEHFPLFGWLEKVLGPTTEREYQLPEGLRRPRDL